MTDNKLALNQVMAWHQIGDKPLPEPVMIISLTDIYIYISPSFSELS